jgi:hypothetical protein
MLNGLAARWAAEHPQFLPVETREIAPPLLEKTGIEVRMRDLPSGSGIQAVVPADPWCGKIVVS